MPALTVHNAEIRTASVEVKTLTLRGKQVTQSVFRQLREVDLIAADGSLNGVPWGTVNYHPGKCEGEQEHWHVVWQRGTDLLRSRVNVDPGFRRRVITKSGAAWLRARVRDDCERNRPMEFTSSGVVVREVFGVPIELDVDADIADLGHWQAAYCDAQNFAGKAGGDADYEVWLPKGAGRRPTKVTVSASAAVRALLHLRDVFLDRLSPEPLRDVEVRLRAEIHDEGERRMAHRDVRKAIADLPQLFIAV